MPKTKAIAEAKDKAGPTPSEKRPSPAPDKAGSPQRLQRAMMPHMGSGAAMGAAGSSSPAGAADRARTMGALQRTIGNAGLGRMAAEPPMTAPTMTGRAKKPPIQAKLTVGPANDPFEREADQAAGRISAGRPVERISRLSAADGGAAQRICTACAKEEEKVQRAAGPAEGGLDAERAESAMARAGPGSRLAPAMRTTMEQGFGADFSHVRVHTSPAADEANRAINARAFTRGSDIYLARGESATDQRLMAHELTHTVQQKRAEIPDVQRDAGKGTAEGLIDRYSSWTGLDEEGLGRRLFDLAWMSPAHYELVLQVMDKLSDTDRDDVAVAMVSSARDEDLDGFAASTEGRAMLDRLYAEMMGGSVGSDEEEQGRRIVLAKGRRIPAEQFVEAAEQAMIFPFRLPGFTVLNDAPIMAKRLPNGNIHVKLPVRVLGTSEFRAETRTLPAEVFISGIELPPDRVVGVRLYDRGGQIEFLPALSLVGFSGEATTAVFQKIGEAAAIGATFGLGGLATAGAEATWGARAVLWLDRAATAIFLVSTVVNEHRGWILQTFPRAGPIFLRAVDIANSVAAVYGLGQLAFQGYRAVVSVRNAWRAWRQEAAAARLSRTEREIVEQVNRSTDDLLNNVDEARASARGESPLPESQAPSARETVTQPPQGGPALTREASLSRSTDTIRHAVCGFCFPAGTKLLTASGYTNIEDLRPGDFVLSRHDAFQGSNGYKRVLATFQNVSESLIEVSIGNQCIKTTPGHVWHVVGKGWILAEDLAVGDAVISSTGEALRVERIQHIAEFAVTYNCEVEEFHTYFVAEQEGQPGLWVHNDSVAVRILRPNQVYQLLVPNIVISDRGAIRAVIRGSLEASGSYSNELAGLYSYLRRGGGAGFQGLTRDGIDRLEVVLRNIQTKGGGVVAAVDLQSIGAGRVFDLADPQIMNRLMQEYPSFENMFRNLASEGVVAVRGKIPALAVQSLVNIPPSLSEAEKRVILQALLTPCRP